MDSSGFAGMWASYSMGSIIRQRSVFILYFVLMLCIFAVVIICLACTRVFSLWKIDLAVIVSQVPFSSRLASMFIKKIEVRIKI
jgi:hypothetical protein